MTHEQAVIHAIRFLENFDLAVKQIPESTGMTADLCAMDGEDWRYYVEVKVKSHDPEKWEGVGSELETNDIAERDESLHRRDAVANVLKRADEQLRATAKSENDFRIVWLGLSGHDTDVRWNQVLATFYGIVYVSPRGTPRTAADHCYYFDHNIAFSSPHIDALAICDGDNFQFCLNEFSPRYELLKQSRLCSCLKDLGAINDPPELSQSGVAILLRSGISRSHENDVIEALRQQEGVFYTPIRLRRYSVYSAVRP